MDQLVQWFSNQGVAALASFVVSVVALVFAIVAFVTSRRIEGQGLAIEKAREKDRIRQSRKASLVAKLVEEISIRERKRDLLRIENIGAAEARKVRVVVDGLPISQHQAIVGGDDEIPTIGPNSPFDYLVSLTLGGPTPPFNVEITWEDDSGEPGKYRTTVT